MYYPFFIEIIATGFLLQISTEVRFYLFSTFVLGDLRSIRM